MRGGQACGRAGVGVPLLARATMTVTATVIAITVTVTAACERPPVQGDEVEGANELDDSNALHATVDLGAFVGDTAAIGADWYDYDSATHVLTPSPITNIWRVQTDANVHFVAVQPRSYYDENTGESGYFTIAFRAYTSGRYGDVVELRTSNNVKTAPVCVDVLVPAVVACPAGHLRLETHPRLIAEAGLVVAEPVLTVPSLDGVATLSTVQVARVAGDIDGVTVEPPTLSYRVNVPEPNMAWGCSNDDDDGTPDDGTIFFVLNRALLGKATRTAHSAQQETWHVATAPLTITDSTFGAFSAPTVIEVPRASADAVVVFDVAAATASTLATPTLTAHWNSGAFARYRTDNGRTCTVLAPGVAMVAVDEAFATAVVPVP